MFTKTLLPDTFRAIQLVSGIAKINHASLPDIAAMKIHAIEDRGTRRDFVDVYFLSKKYTLEEMLGFYQKNMLFWKIICIQFFAHWTTLRMPNKRNKCRG